MAASTRGVDRVWAGAAGGARREGAVGVRTARCCNLNCLRCFSESFREAFRSRSRFPALEPERPVDGTFPKTSPRSPPFGRWGSAIESFARYRIALTRSSWRPRRRQVHFGSGNGGAGGGLAGDNIAPLARVFSFRAGATRSFARPPARSASIGDGRRPAKRPPGGPGKPRGWPQRLSGLRTPARWLMRALGPPCAPLAARRSM
jgi:hypothetical protein